MNFFTTNSSNLSNPSSLSMTSALSAQNNQNTTSQFGTSGGLFGSRTQPPSFGFSSNMPNPQEKSAGFGNILQSSNLNNSNTNNGGYFTRSQSDAQKQQGGLFGSTFNGGKENVSQNTTNNAGLGGWKAAGAQMQSIFGSQVSSLGVGSTGSQSLTTNFMSGSANGNISSTGTVGYSYNFDNLSKTKDNIPIYTVTGVQGFREKTIDELRGEDYKALKNNGIPDQRLMELKNMWQNNQGSSGSGSGSTNLLSMITSNNSNTQQANPTLNSFSQNSNQNSVSNLQNSLFGGSNNGTQAKPSTPVFGPSSASSLNPNVLNLGGGSQSSSLLGNSQNQGGLSSTSMFSSGQQQSQLNGGGLMSSNQNQGQSQGGLFQSGGGMFNQTSSTNQTTNSGNGLFSGSVNSLLGPQNQNQNSTTGANPLALSGFGLGSNNSNSNNNNSTNPFSMGLTQNTQASAATQNPMFNQGTQGAGLFNSTNTNQNSGAGLGTGLFNMNQASQQANIPSTNGMAQNSLNSFGIQNQPTQSSILGQISQNVFQPSSSQNNNLTPNPLASTKELWSSMLANGLNISFGDFDSENWQPEVAVKQYDLFGNTFGYKSEDGGNVRQNYPYNNENMFSRNMKSKFGQNPFENSERKRSFYQSSKTLSEFKRPYPHYSNSSHTRVKPASNDIFLQKGKSLKRVMRLDYDSEQNIEKKKNADIARFYSYITICVAFNKEDNEEDIYTFDVGLNDTCSELKNHVLKQVLNSEGLRYKMLYNQKILKEQMSIQEAGLKDREKIYLIPDFDSLNNSEDSTNLSEASRKCLASEDMIPLIPKHLKTVPALVKLSRMSEDELANIQDFTIYNENARVTFPGKTDIRGINLGEMIVLGHRSVEVYPHSYHAEMPRAGKGLNKKAIIEFYNWALPSKYENQASEYVMKLKKKFNSLNAEYKKYDVSQQSLIITVQNFSSL